MKSEEIWSKKMIKKILVLAVMGIGFSLPAQAMIGGMGGANAWPVKDEEANGQLKNLIASTKVLHEALKTQAKLGERNEYTTSFNNAQQGIREDLKRVITNSAPTVERCVAVSKGMVSSAMNASANRQMENTEKVLNASVKVGNEIRNSLVQRNNKDATLNRCTMEDVQAGLDGCTKPGALAPMAENLGALFVNPLNNSRTFDELAVQNEGLKTLLALQADLPSLDQGGKNGTTSTANHMVRKVYNAGTSASRHVLKSLYNEKMPMFDGKTNNNVNMLWMSPETQTTYAQIYGQGAHQPLYPSIDQWIDFAAKKDFLSANSIAQRHASTSEVEALRNLGDMIALQNYLMKRTLDKINEGNAVAASTNLRIYAQMFDEMKRTSTTGN